jgi:UDP-N-acetylglucosamine transferase subunit ALG13
MMLVTVGTIQYPFGRMVKVVSNLIKQYPQLDTVIQSGHTTGFNRLEKRACVRPFIPQHELWQLMRKSQVLLMHGGEGSLLDALEWSRNIPIVFPRDMKYGEHVDNYQLEIAKAAAAKKLCDAAFSENEALKKITESLRQSHPFTIKSRSAAIQNTQLIDYLHSLTSKWYEKK